MGKHHVISFFLVNLRGLACGLADGLIDLSSLPTLVAWPTTALSIAVAHKSLAFPFLPSRRSLLSSLAGVCVS
jgi:hypothetical protein